MKALKAAFPYTVPILAGFLLLGIAYGIYMSKFGFSPAFPAIMSATIFAGSMELLTVNILLGAFSPLRTFMLTLLVNARHLFYGISMLDKYRGTGRKKAYLIFLHVWKRQMLVSIAGGTVIYMLLVQFVF